VKTVLLLIALDCPLHAELLAHFLTSQGEVVAELQHDKAPQAVANFITLAEGTRTWVDPATGAVRKAPYYNGTKFHRTESNGVDELTQGGSRIGDGSDGPGYTLRDEFDPALTHTPYALSMANAGPNTNGGSFFLTGNVSVPSYDGSYTLFGYVKNPASRAVVDAIIAAGPNGTTLQGVTFERTDAAALAFNEHAHNLPVCSGVPGTLTVSPEVEATYHFTKPQSPGTVLQGFSSSDLVSWEKLGEVYQGTGLNGSDSIALDSAILPKAFYNISIATYPDALAPASLAGRTLVMGLFGTQTLTFQFDNTGTGGIATYSANPTQPTPITSVTYQPNPHAATWKIETVLYNPFLFRCYLNTSTSSHIFGTNQSYQGTGAWTPLSSGALSLTK